MALLSRRCGSHRERVGAVYLCRMRGPSLPEIEVRRKHLVGWSAEQHVGKMDI